MQLSFLGRHLTFCCLLYSKRQKAGRGLHGNEAILRLCVAKGLQQGITSSIVHRPFHSELFDHLQHSEGLGDFHMIVVNC